VVVGAPASGWLLPPAFFFFFLFLLLPPWAAVLSSGLAPFPTFGVGWACQARPSVALAHLSTRLKKLRDILDVMCGELFQHLLIPHTLAKRDYNRSIGNMSNDVANLREPLDEGV
jgi:hypothetical protein